jgi:membrane protease YdiL (CAAX protease family)
VTTALPQGPGQFGARKWVTLGLSVPVTVVSAFFALGFVAASFDDTLTTAGHLTLFTAGLFLVYLAIRCLLVGFVVVDDYVRVRGVWATRTVRRDQIAGFVMECDPADRFHFPTVVATDGRRIRARWAFRRAQGGSAVTTQEIVDAFNRLGWYDEPRLDAALNATDAVRRGAVVAYRWQTPPGWPPPPPGWRPAPGWLPPPDWPPPPAGFQYWQRLEIPVVVSADVAADPDEAPPAGAREHLDTRYALDLAIAKGLPNSDWGMGECGKAIAWLIPLVAASIAIEVWVSGRLGAFIGESAIGLAVVLGAGKAARQSGGWGRALGWELPKLRETWIAFRWFGWNLAARFVAGVFFVLITLPLRGKPQSNVDVSGHKSVLGVLVLIVVAVVIAPVVEEFFFRGLLLRAGMRRFPFWPAAIVTSVLFGLAHVYQVDSLRAKIILGGSISAFGLVQSLLVRRTAKLGANMWVHGFANGLVVLFALA